MTTAVIQAGEAPASVPVPALAVWQETGKEVLGMRRFALAGIMVLIATSGMTGITLTSALPASAVVSCTSDGPFLDQAGNDAFIPTITYFGSDNCELGPGNHSQAVLTLQNTLNACYGQNLARDSDYGPLTQEAVEDAQQAEHITADGIYGPVTRSHLKWLDDFGRCSRLR